MRTVTDRQHAVRDGDRTLEFDGELLAESTSRYKNQPRWIEFKLYRTRAGAYILSRVGNSIVYHATGCSIVSQYRLKSGDLVAGLAPCEQCQPDAYEGDIYPERIRYWAQVMEQPAAVLEALYKYDSDGTKYLTLVAQRLMGEAAKVCKELHDIYIVEYVA